MKFLGSLSAVFLVLSINAFAADQEIYRSGSLSLGSITVEKDGVERTYSVDPKTLEEGFFLWGSEDSLSVGMTTKCPPYIGLTVAELRIDAEIKEAYQRGGYDANFRTIKIPVPDQTGKATLVVPKGTHTYGQCGGKDPNALTELKFQTRDGIKIRVELKPAQISNFQQNEGTAQQWIAPAT